MIIADTGFWVALLFERDRHHALARTTLARLNEPLVVTWPVITEVTYLLASRSSPEVSERFIESGIKGAWTLFDLTTAHLPRVRGLMAQYGSLPMDLADASLVVLAEHLGHGRILSTDRRDFQTYRWKNRAPFENLLFDGAHFEQ